MFVIPIFPKLPALRYVGAMGLSGEEVEDDPRMAEVIRRIDYVAEAYLRARAVERQTGSFNQSLAHITRALGPRARSAAVRRRLHPALELAVRLRWRARYPDVDRAPTPDEIHDICSEISRERAAVRGRPDDVILRYHVQGLMILYQKMTGKEVKVSRTKNSVYNPTMTSFGAQWIENIFKKIDPCVSTTLVNIVRETRKTGAIAGVSFCAYFPFYGGDIDPAMGTPRPGAGFRLELFEPLNPIYCP
jgi:hypothetical protein